MPRKGLKSVKFISFRTVLQRSPDRQDLFDASKFSCFYHQAKSKIFSSNKNSFWGDFMPTYVRMLTHFAQTHEVKLGRIA